MRAEMVELRENSLEGPGTNHAPFYGPEELTRRELLPSAFAAATVEQSLGFPTVVAAAVHPIGP